MVTDQHWATGAQIKHSTLSDRYQLIIKVTEEKAVVLCAMSVSFSLLSSSSWLCDSCHRVHSCQMRSWGSVCSITHRNTARRWRRCWRSTNHVSLITWWRHSRLQTLMTSTRYTYVRQCFLRCCHCSSVNCELWIIYCYYCIVL